MFAKKKLIVSMLATVPMMAFAASDEIENSLVEEDSTQLDTLVVTATMAAKKIEDIPAFATVITKDDIAQSTVSSVSDLLRETVGVNNLSDATGRDEIQIRGLDGEYTVLLVNGKRVSSGSAFAKGSDTDLNSVPLNSIERIEIIRGPMSVLYGADAIGGVVNIITKKPQVGAGWTGTAKAEVRKIESGEGGNQYRLGVSGMGAINDKLALSISVEDFSQKAWYADADSIDPLREKKNAQNLSSTLTWQAAENQEVEVDFGYNHDERPYQVFSDSGSIREQEITRTDLAVTHKGKWSWADTTVYIKREESDVYDYNTQYADQGSAVHDDIEANNTSVKAYANKLLGMHSLMAGVDYQKEQLKDDNSLDEGDYSTDQNGVFVQDELSLTDKLTFTLGGRFDDHKVYGSNFSPKAYLVYGVNDSLTLKGGVTEAFKAPALSKFSDEYYQPSCGGSCRLYGNPDLEAETSVSYEFGFDYHTKGFTLIGTVFRNNIENKIDVNRELDSSGNLTVEWINVDKAMTQGVELSTTSTLTEDLLLKANYTYLDTEAEDGDGTKTVLTNIPEHQASLSLDYQATDVISTYLSVNYIAGMQYDSDGESELPSYYRTDIGLTADVTDNLVLRAGIKNIGDVRIDEEDTNYITYELGRNYYVSAAYNF